MSLKQLEAETTHRAMLPAVNVLFNPGDLVAKLGNGQACSVVGWPQTHDPISDRRAFAAAFQGLSNTHLDPKRRVPNQSPVVLIDVAVGGSYERDVGGIGGEKVEKDAEVGPAIVDGKLTNALEVVEHDQAVGVIVAASGGGWKVKLYGGG